MAYQVLARKWRPMTFKDMIGQDHISETLLNAIQHNRVGHAYLFVGTRGIGKTTSARIFAKALNCLNPEPNGNPCDVCQNCTEITNGSSLDVMEIDGASNNKVEDIRDIRDNVQYAPARCKYKIYIIDEAHMLTTAAWNALLKTLEEPPEHVKFFFATTEVHKVLPTILSRCQRFDLKRIPQAVIADRLRQIAQEENIPFADSALNAIARAANGGMRDALSITDQMIAFCSNTGREITEEDVTEVFGLTSSKEILDILKAIIENNAAMLVSLINRQADKGKNLEQLYSDLLTFARNIMVIVFSGQEASKILQLDPAEFQQLHETARLTSPSTVQRIVDGFLSQDGKIRHTLNKRIYLEVSLIKIMREANSVQLEDILKRINHLRKGGELADFNEQVSLAAKDHSPLPEIADYSFEKRVEPSSAPTPVRQSIEAAPSPEPQVQVEAVVEAVETPEPQAVEITPSPEAPVAEATATIEPQVVQITPTTEPAEPQATTPAEPVQTIPASNLEEEPSQDLDETHHVAEELTGANKVSPLTPQAPVNEMERTQSSMTQTLKNLEDEADSTTPSPVTETVILRRSLPDLNEPSNTSSILNDLAQQEFSQDETQTGDTSGELEPTVKPYANLKKVETVIPETKPQEDSFPTPTNIAPEALQLNEDFPAPTNVAPEPSNDSFLDKTIEVPAEEIQAAVQEANSNPFETQSISSAFPAPVNLKTEEEVAQIQKTAISELDQTLIDDATPTINREINDTVDYPIQTLINPEQLAEQIKEDPLQLGFAKRQKAFNPEKESSADLFYKIQTHTEVDSVETLNSTINPEENPLLQTDSQVPEQADSTIAPEQNVLLQTDHQVPEESLETTIAPEANNLMQTDAQVPEESLETTIAPEANTLTEVEAQVPEQTLESTIAPTTDALLQTDSQVPEQSLETTIAPEANTLTEVEAQVPEQALESTIAPTTDALLQTDSQVPEQSLETTIAPETQALPSADEAQISGINHFIEEDSVPYEEDPFQTITSMPETLNQELAHQTQTINTVPVPSDAPGIWQAMHAKLVHSSISSVVNEIKPITWQNDNLCLGLDFNLFGIDNNAREAITQELQKALSDVTQSKVADVRLMPVQTEKEQKPQVTVNEEIWNRVHQDEFIKSVSESFAGKIIDARGHNG